MSSMIGVSLSADEQLLYEVIKRETIKNGGVLQSRLREFTELQNYDSRQIARLVLRLVKKGLVRRQPVRQDGRSTYLLEAILSPLHTIRMPIKIENVIAIPCFTCKELERCNEGNYHSPTRCPYLTRFIQTILSRKTSSIHVYY
ncbi:MAG: hypothetical protein DRO12_00510 [Thermoprotei archaeon]|nr:MAG: hypothetical protein DRO12_00510 [Thermoprotei archaeon]